MRWNAKPEPNVGDLRHRKRFAWLPTAVAGNRVVWLERYLEVSKYVARKFHPGFDLLPPYWSPGWELFERRPLDGR